MQLLAGIYSDQKEERNGVLRLFFNSYRNEIETRNRGEIPFP